MKQRDKNIGEHRRHAFVWRSLHSAFATLSCNLEPAEKTEPSQVSISRKCVEVKNMFKPSSFPLFAQALGN